MPQPYGQWSIEKAELGGLIYQQPHAVTLIICYNLDLAGARPADFHSP